jgi:aldose 1-epimerase
MYEHRTAEFGPYTQHEIVHEQRGNRIVLLPDYSACVLSLSLNGKEIIDGYQKPLEVDLNRWFKNLPLFPFPNRLDQGQYTWEGKTYQFAINDVQTGTALHGFSANKRMEVAAVELEDSRASILCRYVYEGKNPGYPFPFTFDILFQISDEEGCTVELSASNDGDTAMPIGLGWHPYFQLGNSVEQLKMQLPTLEMVGVDEHMIPTGKLYEYDRFASPSRIGAEVLDNCFKLSGQEERAVLTLSDENYRMAYWQESAQDKFPYVQIFTPPHRKSIAIEPMSCNVNAFNNLEGLWVLEAGERKAARFGLQLSKISG